MSEKSVDFINDFSNKADRYRMLSHEEMRDLESDPKDIEGARFFALRSAIFSVGCCICWLLHEILERLPPQGMRFASDDRGHQQVLVPGPDPPRKFELTYDEDGKRVIKS